MTSSLFLPALSGLIPFRVSLINSACLVRCTISHLTRLLKANEEATTNLIRAIETGKSVELLSAQIEKRQSEKKTLETQLAKEKLIHPILTYDRVKFFFDKFKNGNANDASFRTSLIESLVNKVCLYDGEDAYADIYCNASEYGIRIPLNKHGKVSPKGQLVPLVRVELTTHGLGNHCSIH